MYLKFNKKSSVAKNIRKKQNAPYELKFIVDKHKYHLHWPVRSIAVAAWFDIFYRYSFPCRCLAIGVFLNLLGIRILCDKKFNSVALFGYMKVYLVNSTIACVLLLPAFVIGRRIAFANEIYGAVYVCYIYPPLLGACFMFSFFIDVAIMLDRISLFTHRLDFAKKYSMRTICAISFACSLLTNASQYSFYYIETLDVYLNETMTIKFYFFKPTQFAESNIGFITQAILLETYLQLAF
jgi:hypothetical protein